MSQVENVPAEEWAEWSKERGVTILDVREPDEWELGTLPGVLRISVGEIIERVEEIDSSKPVLVVCRSGGRSMQVAEYLAANGYETANLDGGMKALGMQE
ncbi:MAG: rhodanese-like domain-containing protein [Actinobacteria bacterium]|nr:rhodanese-like domain-containing protein [Actinomycetota bacterium]